jgi:hypothetical protein
VSFRSFAEASNLLLIIELRQTVQLELNCCYCTQTESYSFLNFMSKVEIDITPSLNCACRTTTNHEFILLEERKTLR